MAQASENASSSAIELELRVIGMRLLEISNLYGCDMMSVRVRRDHNYVNGCAFVGNDIVASTVDWVGGDA